MRHSAVQFSQSLRLAVSRCACLAAVVAVIALVSQPEQAARADDKPIAKPEAKEKPAIVPFLEEAIGYRKELSAATSRLAPTDVAARWQRLADRTRSVFESDWNDLTTKKGALTPGRELPQATIDKRLAAETIWLKGERLRLKEVRGRKQKESDASKEMVKALDTSYAADTLMLQLHAAGHKQAQPAWLQECTYRDAVIVLALFRATGSDNTLSREVMTARLEKFTILQGDFVRLLARLREEQKK